MRDALKFTAVLNAMRLMLLLLRERSCAFYVLFFLQYFCVCKTLNVCLIYTVCWKTTTNNYDDPKNRTNGEQCGK